MGVTGGVPARLCRSCRREWHVHCGGLEITVAWEKQRALKDALHSVLMSAAPGIDHDKMIDLFVRADVEMVALSRKIDMAACAWIAGKEGS